MFQVYTRSYKFTHETKQVPLMLLRIYFRKPEPSSFLNAKLEKAPLS